MTRISILMLAVAFCFFTQEAKAQNTSDASKLFLADLKEIEAKMGPWGFGKGELGNPEHTPIVLNGSPSSKGLGMHPPAKGMSFVKYDISKKGEVFVASVGLAGENVRSESPLVFQVLGDGKILWKSKPISSSGTPSQCKIHVSNVTMLELRVVCSGKLGGAHAVWFEPHLQTKVQQVDKKNGPTPTAKTPGETKDSATAKRQDRTTVIGYFKMSRPYKDSHWEFTKEGRVNASFPFSQDAVGTWTFKEGEIAIKWKRGSFVLRFEADGNTLVGTDISGSIKTPCRLERETKEDREAAIRAKQDKLEAANLAKKEKKKAAESAEMEKQRAAEREAAKRVEQEKQLAAEREEIARQEKAKRDAENKAKVDLANAKDKTIASKVVSTYHMLVPAGIIKLQFTETNKFIYNGKDSGRWSVKNGKVVVEFGRLSQETFGLAELAFEDENTLVGVGEYKSGNKIVDRRNWEMVREGSDAAVALANRAKKEAAEKSEREQREALAKAEQEKQAAAKRAEQEKQQAAERKKNEAAGTRYVDGELTENDSKDKQYQERVCKTHALKLSGGKVYTIVGNVAALRLEDSSGKLLAYDQERDRILMVFQAPKDSDYNIVVTGRPPHKYTLTIKPFSYKSGDKLAAYKAIVDKLAKAPSPLDGAIAAEAHANELQKLIDAYEKVVWDWRANRNEAKQIVELWRQRVHGKYRGGLYNVIDFHGGDLVQKLLE